MIKANWLYSLRFQIVALLTLALLPLGAVAIYQTSLVEEQAAKSEKLALLGVTTRTASVQELTLRRAADMMRFLSESSDQLIRDPAQCRETLAQFVETRPTYGFIGIVPLSGPVGCSSAAQGLSATDQSSLQTLVNGTAPGLVLSARNPVDGRDGFLLTAPYPSGDDPAGHIVLFMPHDQLPQISTGSSLGNIDLLTFDANGEIALSRTGAAFDPAELPQDRALETLDRSERHSFVATNTNGAPRIYTVAPIAGSSATVLGIWRVENGLSQKLGVLVQPAVFPVLMWLASMGVALLSIYTLVLRHLSRLRRDMDAFSRNRSVAATDARPSMPHEIQALNDNFTDLSGEIMHEEAKLENSLREKNVLIKEVHHRVKNNLQLIASIMNMQIRSASQAETKAVLSRVQDRVLSLATIHRDLYQSQHGGRVDAANLVSEIVQKSLELGVADPTSSEYDIAIGPVFLFPDQAVPLSLLAAEAMTNAMKHLGPANDERPALLVRLAQERDQCSLRIENVIGTQSPAESTGLGSELMNAFALQLGGQMQAAQTGGRYVFEVTFKVEDFHPDTPDF